MEHLFVILKHLFFDASHIKPFVAVQFTVPHKHSSRFGALASEMVQFPYGEPAALAARSNNRKTNINHEIDFFFFISIKYLNIFSGFFFIP